MVPDWFGLEFAALLVVPQRLAVGRGVYAGSAQRWPSRITAAQLGPSLIWMAPWRGHGGHGQTGHGSRNLVAPRWHSCFSQTMTLGAGAPVPVLEALPPGRDQTLRTPFARALSLHGQDGGKAILVCLWTDARERRVSACG